MRFAPRGTRGGRSPRSGGRPLFGHRPGDQLHNGQPVDIRTRVDLAIGATRRDQVIRPQADECPVCGEPAEQDRAGVWECKNRGCHVDTYDPRSGRTVSSW